MANEFKIKNGLIVDQGGANITGSTLISGSLTVTEGITGSLFGTSSYAITASYALNGGGGGGAAFPYTGSAEITGSLSVTGSLSLTNNITVNHSTADARFYLRNTTTGYNAGDGLLWELDGVDAYLWNYENGPFYFGTNATARMTILGNGNIGIGTTSPSAPLHIKSAGNTSGTYNTTWYNSDNTWLAGMRDDGLLLFLVAKRIYMNQVNVGEYGTNNTVLGFGAGGTSGYNGGTNNTSIGYGAGLILGASSQDNTFIGHLAGYNTTTGQGNTFIGRWAGVDNSTGAENMFLGTNAGQKNTTGNENVAIGTAALNANTIGGFNVSIGNQSATLMTTGSYNTYIGRSAGANSRNTSYNTTLGFASLFGNHSGSENIAIGMYAGAYLTDGSTLNSQPTQSIYIGSYTSASSATEQNAIVIGHGASGLGSNTVVLGNDNITLTALKGNVGIGTTSLSNIVPLQINGSGISGIPSGIQFKNVGAGSGFFMSNPSAGNYADFEFWNYENGFFRFGTNNQEILRMTSGGDVGIKTTSPSARLHVKGSGTTDTTNTLRVENSAATPLFIVRDDGNVGIGTASPSGKLEIKKGSNGDISYFYGSGILGVVIGADSGGGLNIGYLSSSTSAASLGFGINGGYSSFYIHTNGRVQINGIGAPLARFVITGEGTSTTPTFRVENSDGNASMIVLDNGSTIISGSLRVTGSSTFFGDVIPGGPYTSNTSSYSLGSATAAWKDLYVSNGSVYFVTGSTSASIQLVDNQITFAGAPVALPTGSITPTASYAITASYALAVAGGPGPSSTVGGDPTQIQYNDNYAFGGVPTLVYDGTTLSATGSFTGSFTGNITNINVGEVNINFGAAPGTNVATTTINNTLVTKNSFINIYIMSTASIDHNADDHRLFALYSVVTPSNIIDNTSFDVVCTTDLRVNGIFTAKYIINNF